MSMTTDEDHCNIIFASRDYGETNMQSRGTNSPRTLKTTEHSKCLHFPFSPRNVQRKVKIGSINKKIKSDVPLLLKNVCLLPRKRFVLFGPLLGAGCDVSKHVAAR